MSEGDAPASRRIAAWFSVGPGLSTALLRLKPAELVVALFCVLLAACSTTQERTAPAPLRVATFNIRLPLASDGPNAWENRRDIVVQVIERSGADLIGTQELYAEQADYIVERLPHYRWFGRDRRGGHDDEHMGIFYDTRRLRLVLSDDFWLSDTPEVPGSISWGHPYPRMATWGLFETVEGGRRFYLFDTHLPYRAKDEEARLKAIRLVNTRIAEITGALPAVLTGDFNTTPDSRVHAVATATLADAWETAASRGGPANTFHGFTGRADRRIDWILLKGFRATAARTLVEPVASRQASDHFPVVAELAWPNAGCANLSCS